MKEFSTALPSRVVFGEGSLARLPQLVADLASSPADTTKKASVLLLSDKGVSGTGLVAKIEKDLASHGFHVAVVDTVPPEPSIHDLDTISASLPTTGASAIVAVGGGSVMDAAKILAVLAGTELKTADLQTKGVPTRNVPVVMVPTTAGTGSESTPNAIVLFPEQNLKVGIVSTNFMPDLVLLDPLLVAGLPPRLTASTGIDAYCHLLECFLARKANVFSDMMAKEGMGLLLPALPKAYENGNDIEARAATLLGAYLGGACIAASGTNAIHALSYPLGGTYRIPHGVANAILLVPVMSYQRHKIASRLAQAAKASGLSVTGDDEADSILLVDHLRTLVTNLGIPARLSDLGVPSDALDDLADAAFGVRRLLDNNPVELSRDDIRAIYEMVR